MSAGLQIAERLYSLAQRQDDPMLALGAVLCLAATFYFLGDFETARQYARNGLQIWRSGSVQSHPEEYYTPVVGCLNYGAMSEWHLGDIACCHAMMDEAISLARKLNDMNALAHALTWAASLDYTERNPTGVDRLASDLIELSTRHNFVYWLAIGTILRGWARSASGDTAEGITRIEEGIRDYRANGTVLGLPGYLARKAEALYLAHRTSEALEAIKEVEALAERFEQRYFSAELYRLSGVLLTAMGADDAQIEASFQEAIRTAKEQKSVSLEKRARATYEEYRRQKASESEGCSFRLPV